MDALVKGGETDDIADSRLQRALDRWREVGIDVTTHAVAAAGATQLSDASRQFRQFAAHEVGGIITEMESALEALAVDPRSRDPLKAILRRQRALLGSARLQEIGVVAEALRASEDMTKVIAKLNVPVKEEWLAVFRSARDVLKASIDPLQRGETPGPTPALSKLRTLRQELLDRYGEGEALSVAGGAPPPPVMPVTPVASAPAPTAPQPAAPRPAPQVAAPTLPTPVPAAASENGVVTIDSLLYRGERALNRALELQPDFERLAGESSEAREKVGELFDLIRLGIA
jgi:chemotaxis protein histidine kinase CheA